jgi:hypothetical protein
MSAWRESAACLDKPVEWFFPRSGRAEHYELGLEVCDACPVRDQCLADHNRAERELGRPLPGLWGGIVHGRADRMNTRRGTPRSCVVCGSSFRDRGTGKLPLYCGTACVNRATSRRARGAPVSDRDFEVWKNFGKVGA